MCDNISVLLLCITLEIYVAQIIILEKSQIQIQISNPFHSTQYL